MDDSKDKPLTFADRALDQYAKGHLKEDEEITPNERAVIKVTFRSLGGRWEDVVQGKAKAIQLLTEVVNAWAQARSQLKK